MNELKKPKKRVISPEIIKKYYEQHPHCELCGCRETDSPHHITFKSRGGYDLPAELITLCNSFSKYKHHMGAHHQYEPFLSEEYFYEVKKVCKSYPRRKADNCPMIFDGKNFVTCKWYGWCRFTYNKEYQRKFKELKRLMKEDEKEEKKIQKDDPF